MSERGKRLELTVHSFDQRGKADVVASYGVDSRGEVVVDIFAKSGVHEAEKRITFGLGKAVNAARMLEEIEKAKVQVARSVENRAAALKILEGQK